MKRLAGNLVFFALNVSYAASLFADEAALAGAQIAAKSATTPVAKTLEPLSYGSALNVIGSLMLVLALLFAAAWVMRRGQGFIKPRSSQIQLVSHLALGVKEKVVLLKVGEENILLGCSSGNMRPLHTWQGDIPDLPHDENHSGGDSFITLLQQQLRHKKGPTQ